MKGEGLLNILLKRICITLIILIGFKIGLLLFLPFANPEFIVQKLSSGIDSETGHGLSSVFNFLSGGGMKSFTLFSVGIAPYIISSILFQLLRFTYKGYFDSKQVLERYLSRCFTLLCTIIQSAIFVINFDNAFHMSMFAKFINILSLIGGSFMLIFLSELISCVGFGSGFSLIIFTGIVADFPNYYSEIINMYNIAAISDIIVMMICICCFFTIFMIVVFERSIFSLSIFYPRRVTHKGYHDKQRSFIPFKINFSGVISPIFASSFLFLIVSLMNYLNNFSVLYGFSTYLQRIIYPGSVLYLMLFFVCIIFFCYFYTNNIVTGNGSFLDNLKKSGGVVLGVRPGNETSLYIKKIINNLTFLGSVYIFVVCVTPIVMQNFFAHSFFLGGTSLLIVVGVVNDLLNRVMHLIISAKYKNYYGSMALN